MSMASEQPALSAGAATAHPSSEATDGIASFSFMGLLGTQFLGAFNDNMYRWLIIWVAQDLVATQQHDMIRSVGAAALMLPFLFLAAPAGFLADRFSKRSVMISVKFAEMVIMALGAFAIAMGNIPFMLVVMVFMGGQSALFGPSKYGSIPELVRREQITKANGLIGLTTVIAIVGGTVSASFLYEWTRPATGGSFWGAAIALVSISLLGLITSLFIRKVPAANPTRTMPWNVPRHTFRDLKLLFSTKALVGAGLGLAFFWGLAALSQITIDNFGQNALILTEVQSQHKQHIVSLLLAAMAGGIGVGSVLAGLLSGKRIELGLVPYGALGMGVGMILLGVLSLTPLTAGIILFLLGISAGLFDIPLEAFLQQKAPAQHRGSVLAAYNFVTFASMLLVSGILYPVLGSGVAMGSLGQLGIGLDASQIFLAMGLVTAGVAVAAIFIVPPATIEFTLRMLSKIFYRIDVQGMDNIPKEGGALIVSNHVSWADAVLLYLNSPRPIRMIGYGPYVEKGVMAWMSRWFAVIPINPGSGRRSIVQSIETAREAVRSGDVVCIFPEGGLTRSGQMLDFKPGAASIIRGTDAPVIPIHLGGLWGSIFSYWGGRFFWKIPRKIPYRLTIRVGDPIYKPRSIEELEQAVKNLEGLNHEYEPQRRSELDERVPSQLQGERFAEEVL